MKSSRGGARTRTPQNVSSPGILRLVRLFSIRGNVAPFRLDWRLLRVLCDEEAEYHGRVPDGRENDGDVPHLYVIDSQVFWLYH